jgi:hypothetical protein
MSDPTPLPSGTQGDAQPSSSSHPGPGPEIGLETKSFCHSDGIAAPTLSRLVQAVAALGRLHELVVCARLVPVALRAPSTASRTPAARLSLPADASTVLGGNFESHLLLADEVLSVWLAGLEPITVGSEVTLLALTSKTMVHTSIGIDDPDDPVRLRLAWAGRELPEEIEFAISSAANRAATAEQVID